MSYARFSEYDVYLFMHVNGKLCCCACIFAGASFDEPDYYGSYYANSTQEMVRHLVKHKRRGDSIPGDIIERLWQDDEDNFPEKKDIDNL